MRTFIVTPPEPTAEVYPYLANSPAALTTLEKDERTLTQIKAFFSEHGVTLEDLTFPPPPLDAQVDWVEDGMLSRATAIAPPDFLPGKPFIVLNGDGNFHHLTYFLVRAVSGDLTYIHVDAHPDSTPIDGAPMDCADFLCHIVKVPNVRRSIVYGVEESYALAAAGGIQIEDISPERLQIYGGRKHGSEPLFQDESAPARFMTPYYHDLDEFDPSVIPTKNVYVSVDLDVLSTFSSAWMADGFLLPPQLHAFISRVGGAKSIVGADICGWGVRYGDDHGLGEMLRTYQSFARVMAPSALLTEVTPSVGTLPSNTT